MIVAKRKERAIFAVHRPSGADWFWQQDGGFVSMQGVVDKALQNHRQSHNWQQLQLRTGCLIRTIRSLAVPREALSYGVPTGASKMEDWSE